MKTDLTLATDTQKAKQSELAKQQNKMQEQPENNLLTVNRHLSIKSIYHKTPEPRRENSQARRTNFNLLAQSVGEKKHILREAAHPVRGAWFNKCMMCGYFAAV